MNFENFDLTQLKLTVGGFIISSLSFMKAGITSTKLLDINFWISKEGIAAIMGFAVSTVVIWMNIETIKLRRAERRKLQREENKH